MSAEQKAGPASYSLARRRLVSGLVTRGIEDRRVLEALAAVPRHRLVPRALWDQAYKDAALPIGEGQTISAPSTVATMTQALALDGSERILEIGTGSGYQAAVLSRLADSVISIERIPKLAASARASMDRLGVTNVAIFLGDGTRGRPADAPFDRIVVTAGGPEVPHPVLLQLKVGGSLVGPFGPRNAQQLIRVVRRDRTRFSQQALGPCKFVDLIGENGWAA